MEYYIEGSEIAVTQSTGANQAVIDLAKEIMEGVDLYMNLWRVNADKSDENFKLESSWVSNVPGYPYHDQVYIGSPANELRGNLDYPPGMMSLELNHIGAVPEGFSDLMLDGSCDYDDAQRLIKQVRLPEWSNNTSTNSALVSWEFSGKYNGTPFSIDFTQVFFGKSRYPVYPNMP